MLAFLVLAFGIWPVVAVAVVGGYGFLVWMYQIVLGPPGPPGGSLSAMRDGPVITRRSLLKGWLSAESSHLERRRRRASRAPRGELGRRLCASDARGGSPCRRGQPHCHNDRRSEQRHARRDLDSPSRCIDGVIAANMVFEHIEELEARSDDGRDEPPRTPEGAGCRDCARLAGSSVPPRRNR